MEIEMKLVDEEDNRHLQDEGRSVNKNDLFMNTGQGLDVEIAAKEIIEVIVIQDLINNPIQDLDLKQEVNFTNEKSKKITNG